MNNLAGKKLAGYRRTLSRLRAVLGGGTILEGSVCRVSAGAAHWHLTRKVRGRTSTLYVPDAEVEAVKEAAARWKEVRTLVQEIFTFGRCMILRVSFTIFISSLV